jgi:ribonuclease BN (tRNA processing enzyme)
MQLTIIGGGTCVPSLKRGSPANFLKIGDKNILVDCGPGTMRQMLRAGISYKDIDYVFLTHFHNDHVADLTALLHALRWTPGYKRKNQLVLVGPVGFKDFFEKLTFNMKGDFDTESDVSSHSYKVKLIDIKDKIEFPRFKVRCFKTLHGHPSTAYRFEEKTTKKALVISGDSMFDESLIKFAKNCNLTVLDASGIEKNRVEGHMTAKECGIIARKSGAKKLVLTHFYPVASDNERLQEAKKEFKNTVLARDLIKINI